MRVWIATLRILAAALLLTTTVLADDADDIKALVMDARAQEGAGNVDGYFQYKGSGYTISPPTRGLLSPGSTKKQAQARFDAGMKFNMQMRNFDVKFYGDTALCTYYLVGTVQGPNSDTPERWNLRMTSVWAKQSGQWKIVHRHESHLILR